MLPDNAAFIPLKYLRPHGLCFYGYRYGFTFILAEA